MSSNIRNVLDQEIIKYWFKYDFVTGKLLWNRRTLNYKCYKGQEAGWVDYSCKAAYRRVTVQNKAYRVHDLIWILHYGPIPKGYEIDHIDHNGLNNFLNNFRLITSFDNHRNRSMLKNNKSGVTGVHYRKDINKWRAKINVNRNTVNLGCFENESDAVKVRKLAEIKHGFHPNHGKDI